MVAQYDKTKVPALTQGTNPEYHFVRVLTADGDDVSRELAALPAGTDRSGTIAAGGAAQTLAPANPARKFLKGQNLSTGDLWVREVDGNASAQQPSYRIQPGYPFSVNTNNAISIWGATTGQAWSATEG